jgi:hypothetical protein
MELECGLYSSYESKEGFEVDAELIKGSVIYLILLRLYYIVKKSGE